MVDPLSPPQETGPAGADEPARVAAALWTPEFIARLDWLLLVEVVRGVAAHGGCELARSLILKDGSVVFGMIEQPGTPQARRALVKTAAWNEWGATAETLLHFAHEVATARDTRGVFIAPGGFSPAALLAAQQHRIETVDAESLCAVLRALPSERSELLHTVASAGEHAVPSCPVCLQKLTRNDAPRSEDLPDVHVEDQHGLVADHILCGRFDVAADSEVTFLHVVQAREMRIAGDVAGDFVCEGPVTLLPGGTLTGTVAARAVQVREGAELRGQFRILEGPPQPFVNAARRWQWVCRGERSKTRCAAVAFEPHEGG